MKYGSIYNTSRIIYDIGSVLGNTHLPRLLDALLRFSAISGDVYNALGMLTGGQTGLSARAMGNLKNIKTYAGGTMSGLPASANVPVVNPASFVDVAINRIGGGSPLMAIGAVAAVAMAGMNVVSGVKKAFENYTSPTGIASGLYQAGLGPILGPLVGGAIDKFGEGLGDFLRSPGRIAEAVGGFSSVAAAGDNARAFGVLYEGITDVAASAPLVGSGFKIIAETGSRVVTSFTKISDAFMVRAQTLMPYSSNIAMAMGRREISGIFADMREAQRLGASMEKLIDSQTRLDRSFQNALLPLKEFLLKHLPPVLDRLSKGVDFLGNWGVETGVGIQHRLQLFHAFMEADAQKMFDLLFDWSKDHKKSIDEIRRRDAIGDPNTLLDRFLKGMDIGAVPDKEARSKPGVTGDVAIPIFKRALRP